ncbi:short-chain collagen C4-like [Saccostrea cucullata]|uniref:short-chain collagen C4-like n=1 Tax=Saccostrea cuccullata TaxID=36930 RepID=UPI002ED43B90
MMSILSVVLIVVVVTFQAGQCFLPGGTVYTRWGRTTCPATATIIYSGYAAGSHYRHTGGAVEPLCLPTNPEWEIHNTEVEYSRGLVYGAEYETLHSLVMTDVHDHDVPCAVCRTQNNESVLAIPARKSCYAGWKVEYWGYLMSGNFQHPAASTFTCMDAEPESVVGGHGNANGYLFYTVETQCGSLTCPPYRNGSELLCVVCSEN